MVVSTIGDSILSSSATYHKTPQIAVVTFVLLMFWAADIQLSHFNPFTCLLSVVLASLVELVDLLIRILSVRKEYQPTHYRQENQTRSGNEAV
ncbi:hypothetical protein EON65_14415 [archaeon]|nr:MAG: hypothetical protein EON65_14415 [archaeon]